MDTLVENPFRRPEMRRAFDTASQAYARKRRLLFDRFGARARNGFATSFWAGYDGQHTGRWNFKDSPGQRRKPGYASWRAGRAWRECERNPDECRFTAGSRSDSHTSRNAAPIRWATRPEGRTGAGGHNETPSLEKRVDRH